MTIPLLMVLLSSAVGQSASESTTTPTTQDKARDSQTEKSRPSGGQEPVGKPTIPDAFKPDPKWKSLGKSIWFDPAEKRLIVRSRVCLREGALEHLMCLSETKEHESILATDAEPRRIHAGLILVAGEPGHPVRYRPKFQPPEGPAISIELEWTQDGKPLRAPAKSWIKDERTGKTLTVDWVFGGSDLFEDPDTKRVIYAADGGDLITVANFTGAILDLPITSSANDAERTWVADPTKIPPKGTQVTTIFRAVKPSTKPKPKP
jgi:hypothetical protein